MLWAGAALGVYLLVTGDTVERVFRILFLIGPIAVLATTFWIYSKALRYLRRGGRDESADPAAGPNSPPGFEPAAIDTERNNLG
jgi:hypothetical protein